MRENGFPKENEVLFTNKRGLGYLVTQMVKGLTLDFGLGTISQFMRSSPESGSVLTVGSLLGILSLSLSLSLPLPGLHSPSLALSPKMNKRYKKK